MLEYAQGPMKGILDVTDEPLVSTDLRGTNFSSVYSSMDTLVIGNMVKVVAWYDNEWGYACRTADLTALVAKSLSRGIKQAGTQVEIFVYLFLCTEFQ